MNQPTVLFVEDEPKVAASIKKGLEENGFIVDHAPDGALGHSLAAGKAYDIVLLDLNLPFKSGYEICQSLRQRGVAVPIIMVTAMGDIDKKISGFEAGADDYIVKPFDFRELLARVRVWLKRNTDPAPEKGEADILQVADLQMNLNDKTVTRQGVPISLTVREFNLLEFLMRRNGKVTSRSEISQHVWELNFDTGTNTVDVYINFLRKKIDKHFEPKLIHTKSGMGYLLKAN
jgi:DNA-binding response OmpR family regulator